jgi:formylglycine-generating enzyme required for sulfatase activity
METLCLALVALASGSTFRDCPECPPMVVVPPGKFEMGSPAGEKDSDEVPRHTVTIAKPFAVAVHEVTRAEFARFVEATGHGGGEDCQVHAETSGWKKVPGADWRNPGFEQTGEHPVVCVSWQDARAYVEWLARETQKPYRLLTESEWEYVARADERSGRDRPLTHDEANYGADECCGPKADGKDRWTHTSPVGSFGPNAFAIHDLRGNAWEWLEDCYHSSYEGAPTDGSARTRDCSNPDRRAVRGGSWGDDVSLLRTTYRLRGPLEGRYFTLGFRIARDL